MTATHDLFSTSTCAFIIGCNPGPDRTGPRFAFRLYAAPPAEIKSAVVRSLRRPVQPRLGPVGAAVALPGMAGDFAPDACVAFFGIPCGPAAWEPVSTS